MQQYKFEPMQALVIIMTNVKVLEGKSVPYSVVARRSYKLPRVFRSNLSAEAQSCATALDELMVKTMLALMCNPDADPRHSSTAADICASASVVDAKGLFDAINKDGIGLLTWCFGSPETYMFHIHPYRFLFHVSTGW